ncbi:MAG TPA: acyltransferase, partial [Mycobacterium sp.]|nr:acyltransferase [Mycobacterium sp.]
GLLPQPELGSGAWWLARLQWEIVLAVVAALLLCLLFWQRRFFAAPVPTFSVPIPPKVGEALLYAGTASAALSLALLSANGFAPQGRLPIPAIVLFVAGALLVAGRPRSAQYTSRR